MKKKIKFIILIALFIFVFYRLNPIEKLIWSFEQAKATKGDTVIYSQWSDKFGWRGVDILKAYRTNGINKKHGISYESHRYTKENILDYDEAFSDTSNIDTNKIKKVELKGEDIPDSIYNFLIDVEIVKFWERFDDIKDKNFVFYILDNKYLISSSRKELTVKYSLINIYDISTGKEYYYPTGMVANVPDDTWVDDDVIEPRYFMCKDGRVYCIYKYYNKLYCHRMN